MPYIDEAMMDVLRCKAKAADGSPSRDSSPSVFDRIVRLVASRERCTSELRSRMIREGYLPDDVDAAIRRSVECGLVDDVRFADVLIRTRLGQGRGRRGIEDELKRLGIALSDVCGWPESYFGEQASAETERALDVLRRHPPKSKNVLQSAYRKLVSKGFEPSVASAASRTYWKTVSCSGDGDGGEPII